jgi:hypothetical protein
MYGELTKIIQLHNEKYDLDGYEKKGPKLPAVL